MANPMFKLKGPKMLARSYDAAFPLKHAQKDMRWVLGWTGCVNQTPICVWTCLL
jgi:3-hydroxyisobutyrate dehydrogenase-like beta-hydroxyacid dehydrogenase